MVRAVDLACGDEYHRPMNATYESVMSSAMELDPQDRCRIASSLWESIQSWKPAAHEDLDAVLNQREAELDADPSMEVGHDAFLEHLSHRRSSCTAHRSHRCSTRIE